MSLNLTEVSYLDHLQIHVATHTHFVTQSFHTGWATFSHLETGEIEKAAVQRPR